MVKLEPYLIFDGTCAEAMRFYERTLGGKLEMMTHGESPIAERTPPEARDRILHARLTVPGNGVLMASDDMYGAPYKGMHGFSVALTYLTAAEGRKVFEALSEGGTVTMPMQETFWCEAFGMLVDRFGTPWMVNAAPQM